jgi:5-formyltetrahydrofolate cyclo-ligase
VVDQADIIEAKRALRQRMRAARENLGPGAKAAAAEAVSKHGVQFVKPRNGAIISAFSSMPDEFRVWPLLRRLAGEGYRLALPVMQGKGNPLIFRAWTPGDAMDAGVWGITEPKPDQPTLEPDIALVPLLAFDATGQRLGYGGGFYDRTLRRLRSLKQIVAVGLAFDESQVDAVPHLDYDERLDWVLTPSGPIRCTTGP